MAKIIAAKGDVLWKTEQYQHVTEKPDKPTLPDMS